MLLETLSDSDIQLLDNTSADTNKHLNTTNSCSVANASDISCHDTCSSYTGCHTSSTSAFAVTTENDLKRLKDKNKNKNTAK